MKHRSEKTWENLVAYYNRDFSPYYQCECGKYVQEKTKEKHEKSTLHSYLLECKKRCDKIKNEKLLTSEIKPITEEGLPIHT